MWRFNYTDTVCHFGIKGQKWGIRRYQNEDGTLTEEGKRRYNYGDVTVERTGYQGEEDFYKLSQKGRKTDNAYYLSGKAYREVESLGEKAARKVIAEATGVSMKDIDDLVNYGLIDRKAVNAIIDDYTRTSLVTVMDSMDKQSAEKKKKEASASNKKTDEPMKQKTEAPSKEKYAKTKMNQEKAIKTAYADLEKIHPDFSKMSVDEQDELFFDYVNESGLYRWI